MADQQRFEELARVFEAQGVVCGSESLAPSDVSVFKFPSSMAWVGLGFSVLGFGLVVVALVAFDPGHDSRALELLLVVGLGLFGTLTAAILRASPRQRCSQLGWHLVSAAERRATFIAWSNATSGRIICWSISLRILDGSANLS